MFENRTGSGETALMCRLAFAGHLCDKYLFLMAYFFSSVAGTFNCNFESNICGWTQAKNDRFDWTRHRGSTASTNTGPSADHTTGSKSVLA